MLTMENKSVGWGVESHKNRLERFCFKLMEAAPTRLIC